MDKRIMSLPNLSAAQHSRTRLTGNRKKHPDEYTGPCVHQERRRHQPSIKIQKTQTWLAAAIHSNSTQNIATHLRLMCFIKKWYPSV